jgi:murein DD-endopeptidase MepM/ murein hydrolase activator NlpD
MPGQSIQGLINHPVTDTFGRSATQLESQIRSTRALSSEQRAVQLAGAAREFESLFVAYLLKVMRETIQESGLFEENLGKSIYTELFDQEVARLIAQRGAFGISDLLIKQFAKSESFGNDAPDEEAPQLPAKPDPPREQPQRLGPDARTAEDIPAFRLPVQAPVSSSYGLRKDPLNRQIRFHKGIDLAAPKGTEVLAALGGNVVFAGSERGYGNTVVVQHERGFQTRYAHLGSLVVRVGDTLQTHQLLGTVGSTGHSTGPHLHFEITEYGERIDPRSAMAD